MIRFNWIYAKPHPDVDAAFFSVVWTGTLKAPESFSGCLGLSGMDSMRPVSYTHLITGEFTRLVNFPAHKINKRIKPMQTNHCLNQPFIKHILPAVMYQFMLHRVLKICV